MLQIVSDENLQQERGFLFLLNQSGLSPNECKFHRLAEGLSPTDGIVLAVGEKALRHFTNYFSISDAHCYVFKGRTNSSLTIVPVYGYKETYAAPEKRTWIAFGISKAKRLLQGETDKQINLIINPTPQQIYEYLNLCKENKRCVVDIEKTIKTHELTTIGFAADETSAICIPAKIINEDPFVKTTITNILNDENIFKIFHNYIFDCMFLNHIGFEIRGPLEDTMLRAHCLQPELPKSLSDLARIYLYCEPWKEKHDWNIVTDDFQRYNARDCVRTFQIFEAQWKEFETRNLKDFYFKHYIELMHPVLDMCCTGIKIDESEFSALKKFVEFKLVALKSEILEQVKPYVEPKVVFRHRKGKRKEGIAYYRLIDKNIKDIKNQKYFEEIPKEALDRLEKGKLSKYPVDVYEKTSDIYEFNPNSHEQLKKVLKSMGVKIPTKMGRETTDTEALIKIQLKHNLKFVSTMMEYGKLATIQENYCKLRLDEDRLKFSIGIGGTKSGRFNSSETPWGSGRNIQNLPSGRKGIEVKQICIPDLGQQLVQVDLSQAELRMVAWLSKDENLIRELEENDVHQYTADEIAKKTGQEVSRDLGKAINHASNYGMGAKKFSSVCLSTQGFVITQQQAYELLEARHALFPGIRLWQKEITDFVLKNKYLTTPWGRTRYFYSRMYSDYGTRTLDPNFVNEALNYIPQSTVADTVNRAWLKLIQIDKRFHILQQCHDSLLMQCPLSMTKDEIKEIINSAFNTITIRINSIDRVIPNKITFGMNWRDMK